MATKLDQYQPISLRTYPKGTYNDLIALAGQRTVRLGKVVTFNDMLRLASRIGVAVLQRRERRTRRAG